MLLPVLLPVGTLALSEADIIDTAALTHARSQNMSPLAVAVVDAAGTMKCLRCEDGAALMRPNIAYSKAWVASASESRRVNCLTSCNKCRKWSQPFNRSWVYRKIACCRRPAVCLSYGPTRLSGRSVYPVITRITMKLAHSLELRGQV